jgi:hypothetical protein
MESTKKLVIENYSKEYFEEMKLEESFNSQKAKFERYHDDCNKVLNEIDTDRINFECMDLETKISSKVNEIENLEENLKNVFQVNEENHSDQTHFPKLEDLIEENFSQKGKLEIIMKKIDYLESESLDSIKKTKHLFEDNSKSNKLFSLKKRISEIRKELNQLLIKKEISFKKLNEKNETKSENLLKLAEAEKNSEKIKDQEYQSRNNLALLHEELESFKTNSKILQDRLNEEKLKVFEGVKYRFSYEENEVRELAINLKMKLSEYENMKMTQEEAIQKQIKKVEYENIMSKIQLMGRPLISYFYFLKTKKESYEKLFQEKSNLEQLSDEFSQISELIQKCNESCQLLKDYEEKLCEKSTKLDKYKQREKKFEKICNQGINELSNK